MAANVRAMLGIGLFALCGMAVAQTNLTVARWPQNREAAISLTFDDAMATQLENVAPTLRKYGLHGTFFVTTGAEAWQTRIDEWKRLAAEGNEIGGHTVHHPCLLEQIKPHSQDYSLEMMEVEIRDSAQAIQQEIGNQHGLSFAYPCGNMSFGPPADQGKNEVLYLRFVSAHFIAARGYGTVAAIAPDELSVLSVPDLGFTAGRDFRGLLQMADVGLRDHKWGVFTFHGVGGQWLSVTSEAFDELAGYLARHAEIWTATFGDAIRYIQESKALMIKPVPSEAGHYRFELTWPLNAQIYDLPLTLHWQLPAGWTGCGAKADGKTVVVRSSPTEAGKAVLLDIAPATKFLAFGKQNEDE